MSWKYFKREEFACNCCGENLIQDDLLDKLDKVRERCGFPFHISSGFRCPSHNAKVGGASESAHVTGDAADIVCKFSSQRYLIIAAALQEGFRRIGIEGSFVHLDIADDKAQDVLWTY